MSTLKVNEVRHLSNSGTANIVLESNATTNLQATSTLGLTVTGTLTTSGVATFNGNVQIGNATTDTLTLTSKVSGNNNYSGFTGEIRMYAGNAAGDDPPDGWLYCNGDEISETSGDGGDHYNLDGKGNDYQALFNLLKASNDWGNSSSDSWGTDTVKVPDFRSRAPVGIHTGAANSITAGLTSRTLSDVAGTETHALVIAELASHTHVMTNPNSLTGISISTITAGSHTHTSASHSHAMAHTHNIATTATSTTDPTTVTSEYMYGRTGVTTGKIAVGGDYNGSGYGTATMGSHTHTFNVPAHSTQGVSTANTSSTTPSATGGTAPSISGGTLTDPQHNHATTAATTGSGTAHTNLSPIIAVNYIIKV